MTWTDNQSYFNEAVTYLASMKQRAASLDGHCLYRTEEGSACVVGHFIPDGHPVAESPLSFKQNDVTELVDQFPDLVGVAAPATDSGLDLATMLQDAHDTSWFWNDDGFNNPDELYDICKAFSLDDSIVFEKFKTPMKCR